MSDKDKTQNEKAERQAEIDSKLDRAYDPRIGKGGDWGFLSRYRKKLQDEGRDTKQFYDGFLD